MTQLEPDAQSSAIAEMLESTADPNSPIFRLTLPAFEGPLDLLLHLIQKHELDILDLPVSFVTERYLAYLDMMRDLNLDVAADYLLMAATLAHIKSRMLLPTQPEDPSEVAAEEELDPRAELIRRLLEYQKYKLAAETLGARAIAGRDVFMRGIPAPEAEGPAPLADIGLYALLDAFERVLTRKQSVLGKQIISDGVSLNDRISQLAETLRSRGSCTFETLFEQAETRYDVIITFLALLEMAKRRLLKLFQTDSQGALHVMSAISEADASDVAQATVTVDEVEDYR